jgi:hypothetical protein
MHNTKMFTTAHEPKLVVEFEHILRGSLRKITMAANLGFDR